MNNMLLLLFITLLALANGQYLSFIVSDGRAISLSSTNSQGYLRLASYNPLDLTQHWRFVNTSLGIGSFVESRFNPNLVFDVSNGQAVVGTRVLAYTKKTTSTSSVNQRVLFNGTHIHPVLSTNFVISGTTSGAVQLFHRSSSGTAISIEESPNTYSITFAVIGTTVNVSVINAAPSVPNFVVGTTSTTKGFLAGTILVGRDSYGNVLAPSPFTVSDTATVTFVPVIPTPSPTPSPTPTPTPKPTPTPTPAPTNSPGPTSTPTPTNPPPITANTCGSVVNPLDGHTWRLADIPYSFAYSADFYYYEVDFCGVDACDIAGVPSASCQDGFRSLGKSDVAIISFPAVDTLVIQTSGGYEDSGCVTPRSSTFFLTCTDSTEVVLRPSGGCGYFFEMAIPREYCTTA